MESEILSYHRYIKNGFDLTCPQTDDWLEGNKIAQYRSSERLARRSGREADGEPTML